MSPAVETTCPRCGAVIVVPVEVVAVAPDAVQLVPSIPDCPHDRPLDGDTFDEQLADYDRRDEVRARRFESRSKLLRECEACGENH